MSTSSPDSVLNLPGDVRMLDVIREALTQAEHADLAVSFTRSTGLALLIDPLTEFAARGGRARLLTSTYQSITEPQALESLRTLPHVDCRVQDGPVAFHSKFWWFRGQDAGQCWIGSTNMSKGGLTTNIEWNLRSTNPALLTATHQQFEGLWARPDVRPLTTDLIERYRVRYQESQRKAAPMLLASHSAPAKPNPAQIEALGQLAALRARQETRAVVIAATGIGKTFLAAFDVLCARARSVLYVSNRLEHLMQARATFQRVFYGARTMGIVGDNTRDWEADIVFATVQSLRGLSELRDRHFDYVVIDEFHHAEAKSYVDSLRPIVDRKGTFLLGITATPERQDGRDVLAWCDWNIAYEVRLPEAIERGWLLPFHYFGVSDDTVTYPIPWKNGKFSIDELEQALSVRQRALDILDNAIRYGYEGPKRAGVGFCAGVRHAKFMANVFNEQGQTALAVTGEQSVTARQEIYRRLEDPDDSLEWLFVADILNEGVDIPAINTLLFLRPTESASIFIQQLGRGLRLFPGTEVLTVLDFVGHAQSAWLAMQALHDPKGSGVRVRVGETLIKPPKDCEIVLQARTQAILEKVRRKTTLRQRCDEAYDEIREERNAPPMPVDLWHRAELPTLRDFITTYGSWVACQRRHGDAPAWSVGLADDHPAMLLLAAAERDWQAQRVGPYALLWGMCADVDNVDRGFELFFTRWKQWAPERTSSLIDRARATLVRKVPAAALNGAGVNPVIPALLGAQLLPELEGRLLYTLNKDQQERHGGLLRTPADLVTFSMYTRPEIVRHFGVQYDPTKHNLGILWFGTDGVILTKLDTSGAVTQHQYQNGFADRQRFTWTSQNKMAPDNEAGRRVTEHQARGLRLHLFVQTSGHEPACYLGVVRFGTAEGANPMLVHFVLERSLPEAVWQELHPQ